MTNRYLEPDSRWLLGVLAALSALGPLSIDMYLPALPVMTRALETDIGHMHLTVSAFLAGFAIFHLACGPLADRFGRKPVLTGGTLLFLLACLGCALADSVLELLVFRFLQGVGACVGPTLARAVARDLFGPREAARALSLIALLMGLGPAVAPLMGGFLLLVAPWSAIFLFLAVYAVLLIWLIRSSLPESLPGIQSLHPVRIARNYTQLFLDPHYLCITLACALGYSALMIFLSSSSFVFIDMLGVPVQYYGFVFLATVFGFMSGSAISARRAPHHDALRTLQGGALVCALAAAGMWLGNTLLPESVAILVLPMALFTLGLGLIMPNAMATALAPYPQMAGTASSLLGFIQMALSALACAVVGPLLDDRPLPMLAGMCLTSLACLSLSLFAQRSAPAA